MSEINDNNNNNDNISFGDERPDKNIDLNRNKNRRSSSSKPENVANDFGTMKETSKEYGNGNDNLLMKSKPKVFCESKQLGLQENELEVERFSSEDEDEDCCNVSTNVPNSFKTETDTNRMDFDEDDMADLSGEDDAAIKNELEGIDKADNDFNENINCDLATYLQQYDYKMDVKKSYKYASERTDDCLTDEDNSKLPTPDILIEHNSKKVQNSEATVIESLATNEGNECDDEEKQYRVDVSLSDDIRDYQPDLIKSITDAINSNDNKHEDKEMMEIRYMRMLQCGEGDNEISFPVEHEIPSDVKETNDNDEKIINQIQTETEDEKELDEGSVMQAAKGTLPLSFESTSSTTVDIIGNFGKEIEKEIGLIVSGYRNTTNELRSGESSPSGKKAQQSIRPTRVKQPSSASLELVFDEQKFIEHLKYFSKVSKPFFPRPSVNFPFSILHRGLCCDKEVTNAL